MSLSALCSAFHMSKNRNHSSFPRSTQNGSDVLQKMLRFQFCSAKGALWLCRQSHIKPHSPLLSLWTGALTSSQLKEPCRRLSINERYYELGRNIWLV